MSISGISGGDLGAAYELEISADLIYRGFDVYRNVSPNGAADLIACKNNILLRVQVKSTPGGWQGCDVLASYNEGNITYTTHDENLAKLLDGVILRKRCSEKNAYGQRCRMRTTESSGRCRYHSTDPHPVGKYKRNTDGSCGNKGE